MNRLIFVFWGLVLVSAQMMAQSKPFIGYDKVVWGVSVADVRKAYSIGENITVEVDDEDPNIVYLTQEQVSDSISKRQFIFNGDKLYRVWVYYQNGSDSNHDALKGLLEQRYGNRTDFNIQSGNEGNIFFSMPYTDYISVFGNFAPDIEVQLIHRKGSFSGMATSEIRVVYTWKKFRDDYQASKLGL